MKLVDFPPEVLGQILQASSLSCEIFDLLAAGCPLLTSKILQGLTHVSLVADRCALLPMPKSLSLCRNLRSLSLSSTRNLFKTVSEGKLFLESLSKTLTSLAIHSTDSHLLFYILPPSSAPDVIEVEYSRGASPWMDIERMFPQLETLEIAKNKDSKILAPGALNWLPALPSTLTSLGCFSIDFGPNVSRPWSLLPPTLRILNTNVSIEYPESLDDAYFQYLDHLANGHPSIEHITTIEWRSAPLDVKWLPRTLKSCGLSLLDMRFAGSLPPQLESLNVLDCQSTTVEWFHALPRSLTSLLFSCEVQFGKNVALLPRNLKVIRPGYVSDFTPALKAEVEARPDESLWPPNLTSASFLRIHDINDLQLIPNSLRYLSLSVSVAGIFTPIDFPANLLPPNLTDFYLYNVSQGIKLTSMFPSTLTRLDLTEFFSFDLAGLTREEAEFLPSSITDLTLSDKPLLSKKRAPTGPFKLPNRLQRLKLKLWHYNWIDSIPKSVTWLQILDLNEAHDSTPEMNTQLFKDLPPGLEYLYLQRSIRPPKKLLTNFPAECVAPLTKIRQLTVKYGLFESGVLRHLPTFMRVLAIPLASLEPEDVPFISSRLTSFEPGALIDWTLPLLADYWPLAAPTSALVRANVNYLTVMRRIAALTK